MGFLTQLIYSYSGQDAVCFDVSDVSGAIVDLISVENGLEINGQMLQGLLFIIYKI